MVSKRTSAFPPAAAAGECWLFQVEAEMPLLHHRKDLARTPPTTERNKGTRLTRISSGPSCANQFAYRGWDLAPELPRHFRRPVLTSRQDGENAEEVQE